MYSTLRFISGLLLDSFFSPDDIFHLGWEKSLCSKYVLSISGVAWIHLSRGLSQEEAGAHPAPDLYLMTTKMVKSEQCVGWPIYLLFTMPPSLPFFSYFFLLVILSFFHPFRGWGQCTCLFRQRNCFKSLLLNIFL